MSSNDLSVTQPKPQPKLRRKRRTTGALIDLVIDAASQEFGKHGYSGATTAAIARRADVTEAQLFRLFGSKEELFQAAIFKPLNSHFAAFVSGDLTDRDGAGSLRSSAHDYIGALQDFMETNARMLMSMAVASTYAPDSSHLLQDMDGMQAYFDRGAELVSRRVDPDSDIDPRLLVRVSFAAVLANVMFKDWLFPKDVPDSAIRRAIAAFVTDGIGISVED